MCMSVCVSFMYNNTIFPIAIKLWDPIMRIQEEVLVQKYKLITNTYLINLKYPEILQAWTNLNLRFWKHIFYSCHVL